MYKFRALSRCFQDGKEVPYANWRLNVRQSATVTAAEFNDVDLEAAKPFEAIPSDVSLPLIGTAWIFLPFIGRYDLKQFSHSFAERRQRFGEIFKDKFGPLRMVTSFSLDDFKTMYAHEGVYPTRIEMESVKRYREYRKDLYTTLGIGILNGKEWWDMRAKTQKHLMKPRAVLAYLDPMQEVARDFVHKIREVKDSANEVSNTLEELNKWALESVCLVGLDTRLGCLEKNLPPDSDGMKMITSVHGMFEGAQKLEPVFGSLPIWKIFPTPTWKRFVKAGDAFTEIAFKHIKRSVEKLKTVQEDDQELTLLQSMIMSKELDVSSAMVMAADMLMAGLDTTAHTVTFFLYRMAKNPEKQEQLYNDLTQILPRKEDKITPAIFHELKYLKAYLKESMRIDPIIPIMVRTLDHDVIFSGYRVPAGTVLMIGTQEIYEDGRYFPKPKEFLPERWLNKEKDFNPYSFLPFGFGVRSCVGRRLAELEMISLISEVIRNFKIEYHHEDIVKTFRMMNTPDRPLRLRFIDR